MNNPANATVLRINGPGDIRAVADIHQRLLAAMQISSAVALDLGGVEEPDISLIQVLEAARRYGVTTQTGLELQEPACGELQGLLERGGFLIEPESRAFWLKDEGDRPC